MAEAAVALPALFSAGASITTSALSAREARRQSALQERLVKYQEYFLEDDRRRNEKYKAVVDGALDELVATPKVRPLTETMVARSQTMIEADLARAKRSLRECMSVYCAPVACSQMATLTVQAGIAKADAAVSAIRAEEARVRTINDKRLADIINVVGNAARGAFQDSATSVARLMDYYGKQREAAQRALSGSLKELGYQATRMVQQSQSSAQTTQQANNWGDPGVDQRTSELLREMARSQPPVNGLDTGDTNLPWSDGPDY